MKAMDICTIMKYNLSLVKLMICEGITMTIRQMELFSVVFEVRNLTRAAEVLFMTQSAVSQNLKKMEEEMGVQLFERNNRQIIPSRAGEIFYVYVKRILDDFGAAQEAIKQVDEHLSFYYYAFPSSAVKDKVIASFWEIDPLLKIDLHDCRMTELLDNKRWLENALYLVPDEFLHSPDIQAIEALSVQHYIIMRKNHRLRDQAVIYPEDLSGETILVQSEVDKRFAHLIESLDILKEKKIPYTTAPADRARELIPKILSFGGVAIVPKFLVSEVPGIISKPYHDGIQIHVKLAYKGTLSPRIRKLLDAFRKRSYDQTS